MKGENPEWQHYRILTPSFFCPQPLRELPVFDASVLEQILIPVFIILPPFPRRQKPVVPNIAHTPKTEASKTGSWRLIRPMPSWQPHKLPQKSPELVI
jgi:hypothetical protein